MSYEQSVITELRRKISGEFETPVKLGAEQKYVKPMLNSHNNNLEEQNILGADSVTTSWTDLEGAAHVVVKYYDGDPTHITGGYYIHFITDFSDSKIASDCYFEGNSLYIPEYKDMGARFEQDAETGEWNIVFDDPDTVSYDENNQLICIKPAFRLTRREVLCFRTNLSKNDSVIQEDDDIVISEKITTQRSDEEGRLVTKSAIINYL